MTVAWHPRRAMGTAAEPGDIASCISLESGLRRYWPIIRTGKHPCQQPRLLKSSLKLIEHEVNYS